MRKNRDGKVFAPKQGDDAAPAAAPDNTTASPNAAPGKQRTRRTVGLTEQRLRAANQESWMTTRGGWVKMFRRFMPGRSR